MLDQRWDKLAIFAKSHKKVGCLKISPKKSQFTKLRAKRVIIIPAKQTKN